jgi:hypothetical protein
VLHLFRSAFGLMRAVGHVHPIGLFFTLIFVAVDVWILVYLFKSEVKQAFGAISF